jgi:hypothetical protein
MVLGSSCEEPSDSPPCCRESHPAAGNFGFAETFGFLLRGQKKVTKEEALNRKRTGISC